MTTSRSKFEAVRVEWADSTSFSTHRWRDIAESKQLTPATIVSVGILLAETKTHIVLTGSLDEDHASGCHTIPRGCIKRMRRLK